MPPNDTWLQVLTSTLERIEGKVDEMTREIGDLRHAVKNAQDTADTAIRNQHKMQGSVDRVCGEQQDLEIRMNGLREDMDHHAQEAAPLLRMGPRALDHITQWVDEDIAKKLLTKNLRAFATLAVSVATMIAMFYAGWHWLKNHV